jgi:predicted MPP superfamily phosphohydrolase
VTRRNFLRLAAGGAALAAFGYPTVELHRVRVETVDAPIAGLPPGLDGLRVGVLSDFHRGPLVSEDTVRRAVRLLQDQSPDLVCLLGDYIQHEASYAASCAEALSGLRVPLGLHAILGNHDYWHGPLAVASALRERSIRVLVNESVALRHGGERVHLVGLDDAWPGRPDIGRALAGVPDGDMKIVLVHEPDYADVLARRPDWLPLQLSGHSHGGQVVLPGLGPPVLPRMGRKYPQGLRRIDGTARLVYTTRGVGWTVPVRINCPPEVTLIVLRSVSA